MGQPEYCLISVLDLQSLWVGWLGLGWYFCCCFFRNKINMYPLQSMLVFLSLLSCFAAGEWKTNGALKS